MAIRRIISIHSDAAAQGLMQRFLLSELSDLDYQIVATGREGLGRLREETYDAVLCNHQLPDMDGMAVREALRSQPGPNRETPLLMLVPEPGPEKRAALRNGAVDHILAMPFSAVDLVAHVDRVCDPRKMREHERVNIPETSATIRLAGQSHAATVVNLSHGGVLCDLAYFEDFACLFTCATLDIQLPDTCGGEMLSLWCDFLRITVLRWEKPGRPATLRGAWQFLEIKPEVRAHLEAVLLAAREELDISRVTG